MLFCKHRKGPWPKGQKTTTCTNIPVKKSVLNHILQYLYLQLKIEKYLIVISSEQKGNKGYQHNLILEKKVSSLEEELEVKEVQVRELLKKTSLDTNAINAINTTLEEVELIKEELINQLEDELNKIKKTHINMIKTYEAKLIEFGIPVEEMGFEPLIPVDYKNDM